MHIIIGSTLDALLRHEKLQSALLLFNNPVPPQSFEHHRDLWDHLVFSANISGRGLFYKKVKNIEIDKEKISILLKNNRTAVLDYELCEVYDYDNVFAPEFELFSVKERAVVYDFFKISSLEKKEARHFKFDSEVFNEIWFLKKDIMVCKSFLKKEQLHDIEYSDLYFRFKLISKLESMGFKGSKNGINTNGDQLRLKIDLQSTKREVGFEKVESYRDTSRVVFHDREW